VKQGQILGIIRAVQAATAPLLGQQMLQRGSRGAIANGMSYEESSVFVNSKGNRVAGKLVERGVLLPNGQGVHIQQAAQQLVLGESELGKRKTNDDLHHVEIRLQNLKCDQLQVECEQMKAKYVMDNEQSKIQHQINNDKPQMDNKIATIHGFANTMELLNPDWRKDQRLVLQATDYPQNSIFKTSSALQLENGNSQSDPISISQVAFEIGISLTSGQSKSVGGRIAKLYKEKYGEAPSKHPQTISGQVLSVNSYTERGRGLLQSTIREIVE